MSETQAPINRAAIMRQKALERRAARAIELVLPSGATVLAIRPDLEAWLMSGRIPQAFMVQVLETMNTGKRPKASEVLDRMKGEDLVASLKFVRELVEDSVVSPRIVANPDPHKDEIAPHELDKDDQAFIIAWLMNGGPDMPVQTAGGGVSVSALGKFRDKRRRAGAGAGKSKVRRPAK